MGTRTDNRTRLLLVISLLLNLLFLSLATVQIQNRGGLPYLVSVFSRYIGKAPIEQTQYSPLDTPRYRERVSIFSTSPATAQIVFLGDSLVERAEWAEFFPGTGAVNRGIGGDTTEGVLKRLDQLGLKPGKSGRVFLYIGINDLLSGIPEAKILANYQGILSHLKSMRIAGITVFGLLPVNTGLCRPYRTGISQKINTDILHLNKGLERLASDLDIKFIGLYGHFADSTGGLRAEFTFDGLHLNGKGYLKWVAILRNEL